MNARMILVFVLLILVSCDDQFLDFGYPEEPIRDNPLDPLNQDYLPPQTTIVQAPSGTIDTTEVLIEWQGNSDDLQFSYRLDDQPFSDWTTITEILLQKLDDGDHAFEVKARALNGDEEDTGDVASFTVDVLPIGTVYLYPYGQPIPENGLVTLELRVKEFTGVAGAGFSLVSSNLSPQSAIGGSYFEVAGETPILFAAPANPWAAAIGLTAGSVRSVSGSGTIAIFTYQMGALQSSTIDLSNVDLRGPNDESITVVFVRGAAIGDGL